MTFAAKPKRDLTAEEVARFREDGVILVRDALEPNWLELIEHGVEQGRQDLSMVGKFMSRDEPIIDEKMDDIPDINADPDAYDLVEWDMQPCDILMFHPLTLHGSYGNSHRDRRR